MKIFVALLLISVASAAQFNCSDCTQSPALNAWDCNSCVLITPPPIPTPPQPASSKFMYGITIGSSLVQKDPKFAKLVDEIHPYVGVVVGENSFKWPSIEKSQGKLDWSGAIRIFDMAKKYNFKVKLHCLFWGHSYPDWLNNLNNQQFLAACEQRCIDVANFISLNNYGKYIIGIDILNEAFNNDGALKQNIFTQKLGQNYHYTLHDLAKKYIHDIPFIYNDYSMEYAGKKINAAVEFAKQLKQKGQVDAIGFQMHVSKLPNPKDLAANFRKVKDAGLQVIISEMDINLKVGTTLTADQKKQQKTISDGIFAALIASKADVSHVITWGVTDKYTWLRGQAPLPFDTDYQAKPFWDSIKSFAITS